jgi:hypothetical protein
MTARLLFIVTLVVLPLGVMLAEPDTTVAPVGVANATDLGAVWKNKVE